MQINKTKCDQCGRERDQQEIGGWPMIRANVGLHASSSEPHDFCDEVCLSGWLLKYHREAVNTAVKSKDLAMVYNVVKYCQAMVGDVLPAAPSHRSRVRLLLP